MGVGVFDAGEENHDGTTDATGCRRGILSPAEVSIDTPVGEGIRFLQMLLPLGIGGKNAAPPYVIITCVDRHSNVFTLATALNGAKTRHLWYYFNREGNANLLAVLCNL
jgi:hypothetical protein